MSLESYLQLPPKVLQAFRLVLLSLWGVTFAAVHSQVFFLYFVPLLALITFFLLPPFPLIMAALFLSGYLDTLPVIPLPQTLKLLLIGATWVAAVVTFSANLAARRLRLTTAPPEHENLVSDEEIPTPSAHPTSGQISSVLSSATTSPHLRHDVITPLNLILAFCEALLTPASAAREPLPASFREDVEAIYRNSQQLKLSVEKLLEHTVSPQVDQSRAEAVATRPRKTVILLDESGTAFELFSQYLHTYQVIRASTVETIDQLRQDSNLLAVVISSDDYTLIPVVAQLVGTTVPILTFNLVGAQPQMQFHGASDYLMKPVEFEALMAALERTGVPLHTVLIIDDNRDNMQMLSRMLNSIQEPPHLLKAYSGREALALLDEETPDVILLDFVLPDMDGLAMLDYLRMEGRLARIPVLLVSAHRPPDILPVAGVTKLTLFRVAGFSPVQLVQRIEAILVALGSES